MNLQKIYRRTEINYLENENGHCWVQLHVGWMVCNWGSGRGFMVGLITLPF